MITNSRYSIAFSISSVSTDGTYLNVENLPSNAVPFIIAENCQIRAWSISADSVQTATSIAVYQNGVLIFNANFNNNQFTYENELSYGLNTGDQISVSVSNLNSNSSSSLMIALSIEVSQ